MFGPNLNGMALNVAIIALQVGPAPLDLFSDEQLLVQAMYVLVALTQMDFLRVLSKKLHHVLMYQQLG